MNRAIPGKDCGACSLCCKVLEIADLTKPAGPWCPHCRKEGGCGIYAERPDICRAYECLWKGDRNMSVRLRPDRVGAVLMEDPETQQYRAVCDPARPFAWLTPLVFKHLLRKAKSGRVVVAKAGLRSWRIRANGEWGPCI
jgi:hypothetical protein